MILFGYAVLFAGLAISLATFAHDLNRRRIGREVPQAAPGRIMPEVHVIGALLSGVGAWLAWTWDIGLAALAGQVVLAFFVIRPLIRA